MSGVIVPSAGGGSNVAITSPVDGSGNVKVSGNVGITGSVAVTGTFWQATQPVSGNVGITGSVAVTGTFWQATQPISGNVGITGPVAVTGTFWQTTQPVSGTFWQATQPVSGTVFAQPLQGTLTNRSGTITTGGTAQTLAGVNATRKYLIIQNLHPTEVLWINFTTTAIQGQPSLQIPANGGSFVMESSFVTTELISVIAATTAHPWIAKEA